VIRVAAVDDEKHNLERFQRLAAGFPGLQVCGLFDSGEELLAYLKSQPLEAVFLDIEMPGLNGLDLSEQILSHDHNIDIIFVTAFNQYAVEAFEMLALDYILKPLETERLAKTVKRLQRIKQPAVRYDLPLVLCFGSFRVQVYGEVLSWKHSKAKEILAFLVHKRGLPVDWTKIADALWPHFDAQKGQANFNATTYLLRKRLAAAGIAQILTCSRGNYQVDPNKFRCDYYEFADLISRQDLSAADVSKAVTLHKGGYLEENGYEWAYPQMAELEEQYHRLKDST
jgi:two-component SAPR family response regulator